MDRQKVVDWIEDLRDAHQRDIDTITTGATSKDVHLASADKYKAEGAVNVLTYLLYELQAPDGKFYESQPEPMDEPVTLETWIVNKQKHFNDVAEIEIAAQNYNKAYRAMGMAWFAYEILELLRAGRLSLVIR